jgi:2,3-dihydroxybenzoate decarboxylase
MPAERPVVIGLEEHWADPAISPERQYANNRILLDLGGQRIAAMDAAGIDVQVLSHTLWRDGIDAETEIGLAVKANNRMKAAVDANPGRFRGFASIPMLDAAAGADELDRAVTELGFAGAMIFPIYGGEFLDESRFRPVFAKAAALDVPIYLHPAIPHPVVSDLYYGKYAEEFRSFVTAAWGFGFEAGTCAMRLIFSRIFDTHPDLRIILGHLGEFIPFGLDRIEERIDTARGAHFPFREYFCDHFYVTTSGFFSTPALLCTIMALGIDRVMFSVDWPMNDAGPAMTWMEGLPLSAEDKAKIYGGNAKRVLKL